MLRITIFCFTTLFCCISNLYTQSVFDNILNPGRLPYLKKSKLVQISSFDSTGGNNDRINIHSGKTATILDMEGPAMITRIWITIDSRDPHFLRRIILRMFWDGEKNPSVEVPVGDFFGTGFQYKHYMSAFTGMTSGGYYCYFPMPFNRSARIEVENQTGQEVYAFYYHIDVQQFEELLDEDVAYFHAQWRREIRTAPGENYVILEAEGEGHFVGVNMSMESYGRGLGYLEGDEMVYVDGEKFPSVYGTGTEDYFTSGWYFRDGEFSAPYHGLIVKDDSLGRIAAYRFHVGDAIPFKRFIRFTIEHGHANSEICDYSSTAFWYQKEPHRKFFPLLRPALRIPLRMQVPNGGIEAEDLRPVDGKLKCRVMDMSGYGPEWSHLKQIFIPSKIGDEFTIPIPVGKEYKVNVDVCFSKGPDYGKVGIYSGSKKIGTFNGFSQEVVPGRKVRLMNLIADHGMVNLTFKVEGNDEKAEAAFVGIDKFLFEPVREYIPRWNMIGPFPNPRESDIKRYGLDAVYLPENEIDLTKTYRGAEGQQIGWTLEETPQSGYMSLWQKYRPYEMVVAYALTYIYSPRKQTIPFLFGTDDGSKVFLNGKEIYRYLGVRIAEPDQERISLNLKGGWNTLLLKIENNFGGYAFYARVIDREKSLIVTTHKKVR